MKCPTTRYINLNCLNSSCYCNDGYFDDGYNPNCKSLIKLLKFIYLFLKNVTIHVKLAINLDVKLVLLIVLEILIAPLKVVIVLMVLMMMDSILFAKVINIFENFKT